MSKSAGCTTCLLWPFVALKQFITFGVKVAGRLVLVGVGLVLIAAGVVFSLTIIGLAVGVPLIMFGFLLLVKGIF